MSNSVQKPTSGIQIAVDYRAVAHIVEGLVVLLLSTFVIAQYGLDVALPVFVIYGIFETYRGLLLLRDIINDSRDNLIGYLALSFLNFLLRYSVRADFYINQLSGVRISGLYDLFNVLRFFYELVLFVYVLRFYWNVGAEKIKEENENSDILRRVFTDYRAVAHIMEGIVVCMLAVFVTLYVLSLGTTDTSYLIWCLYGVFECTKGLLLRRGIIKGDKSHIRLYLVLSMVTISIKLALVVFANIYFHYGNSFFSIFIIVFCLYFLYEWLLLQCVVKFGKIFRVGEKSGEGGNDICYEKLGSNVVMHI